MSIHQGSCMFGSIDGSKGTGHDITAISDKAHDYAGGLYTHINSKFTICVPAQDTTIDLGQDFARWSCTQGPQLELCVHSAPAI
jgi:hypothetical protein